MDAAANYYSRHFLGQFMGWQRAWACELAPRLQQRHWVALASGARQARDTCSAYRDHRVRARVYADGTGGTV